jgi:hypothetical protein
MFSYFNIKLSGIEENMLYCLAVSLADIRPFHVHIACCALALASYRGCSYHGWRSIEHLQGEHRHGLAMTSASV